MSRMTGPARTSGCGWLQYDHGRRLIPEVGPGPFTMRRYSHLLPMSDRPVHYSLAIGGMTLFPVRALRAALGTPSRCVAHETYGPTASNEDRATGALVLEDGLRHGPETVTPASMGNTADETEFGAAAAGMRASIFVWIDRQEEKSALMTKTGALVFGLPVLCRQTAGQPMMTLPARVLPIQSHQSVPIWATTEQTEE